MDFETLQCCQIETYSAIQNLVSNFKKCPKDRLSKAYLETRLEMLETYWKSTQDRHDKLITATKEQKQKLTYFEKNIYENTLDLYFDLKTRIKEKIDSLTVQVQSLVEVQDQAIVTTKLPPIEIPKFGGDYKDWLSFHDLFESLVHKNPNLSKVNKCQYLKSSLYGDAEKLVKHLQITETNYDIMWDILNKRYHNKRSILNAFLSKLLNQKRINESAKAIKDLLDVTSECLISLKAIDIPTDKWDDIVVYIIIQKLDTESHKLFEQRLESTNNLPTWQDLADFLVFRFRTLEAVKYKEITQPRQIAPTKSFTTSMSPLNNCLYWFCNLSATQRQQYIQNNNMFFNCLRRGHAVKDCTQSNCRKCHRKHHTLLHGYTIDPAHSSKSQNSQNASEQSLNSTPVNIVTNSTCNITHRNNDNPVILATALVNIQSNRDNSIHTLRALVDQGSQASLISEGACQVLGLKRTPVKGNIVGVSANKTLTKALVAFDIMSTHNPNIKIKIEAYVLKRLTSYLPQYKQSVNWPQLNSLKLADSSFQQPSRIDIILGADIFAEIILQGIHKNKNSTLVAQETLLGWLISGKNIEDSNRNNLTHIFSHHTKIDIDRTLRRFWELEEPISDKRNMTNEEIQCEKYFETTHKRHFDGRYEVRLPFKNNPPDIGESFSIASRRLASVEYKFNKYPDLQNRYNDFMKDYYEQNHMEIISPNEISKNSCYLPHHAIINEHHLTTKLRVVFDASASTSNGKSLNDNLLIGPA
ncbi:hypothetical protein K1T71_001333 [Dendrolimus kikuchii]|uniref:Uncharacterized protein n=1 Tax=Dendrolimus kikuchii TaxID=765133 RepID=A0ACC1DIC5_9NEOP|nr:hypothetical protein K1T71_001333 [Dendrolimus kikuchii]